MRVSDQGTHHHRKQKSQPGPSNTRRRLQPEGRPSLPAGPRSGLSSSSLGRGSLNSRSIQEPGFTRNEQESNCLPNVQVSRLDRGFKPFMGGGNLSGARSASWSCQSEAHNRQAASRGRGRGPAGTIFSTRRVPSALAPPKPHT